jgi:hypothetical protein
MTDHSIPNLDCLVATFSQVSRLPEGPQKRLLQLVVHDLTNVWVLQGKLTKEMQMLLLKDVNSPQNPPTP